MRWNSGDGMVYVYFGVVKRLYGIVCGLWRSANRMEIFVHLATVLTISLLIKHRHSKPKAQFN